MQRHVRGILTSIDEVLRADSRVRAAWLCGSFGRDEADAWSDLDLRVAINDAAFASLLASRPALYEQIAQPILVQDEMASSTMPDGRFQLVIYPGPIEVDWVFEPVSKATRLPEVKVLFDWIGVPISVPPPLPRGERRARAERD
jgi:predicted nucleotidyltransferase